MRGIFMSFKKIFSIGLVIGLLITIYQAPVLADSKQLEIITEDEAEHIFDIATLNQAGLLNEYQLGKYDVLNVAIVGLDEEKGLEDIIVGPDGYVHLPYVGAVKLAGLSIPEATYLIKERLGEYIRVPALSLSIKTYAPRKVYIMGEVKSTGVQTLANDSMDVFAAISSAQGITKRGRPKHVQVIRVIDNKMYVKEINLDDYVKKHDVTQNVRLLDGDMIYVPSSNKIIFTEDILPYFSAYGTYKAITD